MTILSKLFRPDTQHVSHVYALQEARNQLRDEQIAREQERGNFETDLKAFVKRLEELQVSLHYPLYS